MHGLGIYDHVTFEKHGVVYFSIFHYITCEKYKSQYIYENIARCKTLLQLNRLLNKQKITGLYHKNNYSCKVVKVYHYEPSTKFQIVKSMLKGIELKFTQNPTLFNELMNKNLKFSCHNDHNSYNQDDELIFLYKKTLLFFKSKYTDEITLDMFEDCNEIINLILLLSKYIMKLERIKLKNAGIEKGNIFVEVVKDAAYNISEKVYENIENDIPKHIYEFLKENINNNFQKLNLKPFSTSVFDFIIKFIYSLKINKDVEINKVSSRFMKVKNGEKYKFKLCEPPIKLPKDKRWYRFISRGENLDHIVLKD